MLWSPMKVPTQPAAPRTLRSLALLTLRCLLRLLRTTRVLRCMCRFCHAPLLQRLARLTPARLLPMLVLCLRCLRFLRLLLLPRTLLLLSRPWGSRGQTRASEFVWSGAGQKWAYGLCPFFRYLAFLSHRMDPVQRLMHWAMVVTCQACHCPGSRCCAQGTGNWRRCPRPR